MHTPPNAPAFSNCPACRLPSAAFTIKTPTVGVPLLRPAAAPVLFCSKRQAPEGTPEETHWTVAGPEHHTWPHLWNIHPRSLPPLDQVLAVMPPDSGAQNEYEHESSELKQMLKNWGQCSFAGQQIWPRCLYVNPDLSSKPAFQKPAALVLNTRESISLTDTGVFWASRKLPFQDF